MALGEEEVDAGVAEVGLVLLVELDQADELSFALDRERLLVCPSLRLPAQLRLVRPWLPGVFV